MLLYFEIFYADLVVSGFEWVLGCKTGSLEIERARWEGKQWKDILDTFSSSKMVILKLNDSFWNSEALGFCIRVQLVIGAHYAILTNRCVNVHCLCTPDRGYTQNPEPRFDVETGAMQCSHVWTATNVRVRGHTATIDWSIIAFHQTTLTATLGILMKSDKYHKYYQH